MADKTKIELELGFGKSKENAKSAKKSIEEIKEAFQKTASAIKNYYSTELQDQRSVAQYFDDSLKQYKLADDAYSKARNNLLQFQRKMAEGVPDDEMEQFTQDWEEAKKQCESAKKEVQSIEKELGKLNTPLRKFESAVKSMISGTFSKIKGKINDWFGDIKKGIWQGVGQYLGQNLSGKVAGLVGSPLSGMKDQLNQAQSAREAMVDIKKQTTMANREMAILGPTDAVRNKYLDMAIAVEDLRWANRYLTEDSVKAEKAWLGLTSIFAALKNTLGDIVNRGLAEMAPCLEDIGDAVSSYVIPAIASVVTAFTNWSDVVNIVKDSISYSLNYILEYCAYIAEALPEVFEKGFSNLPDFFMEHWSNIFTLLKNVGNSLLAGIEDIGLMIYECLPKKWQDAFSDIRTMWDNFTHNCAEWGGVVINWAGDFCSGVGTSLGNLVQICKNLWTNIKVAFKSGKNILEDCFNGFLDVCKKYGSYVAKVFENIGKNIWNFGKAVAKWMGGGGWDFKSVDLSDGLSEIDKSVKKKAKSREEKNALARKKDEEKNLKDGKNKDGSVNVFEFGMKKHNEKSYKEWNELADYKNLTDGIATDEQRDAKRAERKKQREERRAKENPYDLTRGLKFDAMLKPMSELKGFEQSPELKELGNKLNNSANNIANGFVKNQSFVQDRFDKRKKEQKENHEGKVRPMTMADMLKLLQGQAKASTESLESAYDRMNNAAANDMAKQVNLLQKMVDIENQKNSDDKASDQDAAKQREELAVNTKDTSDYTKNIFDLLQRYYGSMPSSEPTFA